MLENYELDQWLTLVKRNTVIHILIIYSWCDYLFLFSLIGIDNGNDKNMDLTHTTAILDSNWLDTKFAAFLKNMNSVYVIFFCINIVQF